MEIIGDLYALGGAATFAISSSIIKRLNIVGNVTQLNLLRTSIGAILFLFHLLITQSTDELFGLSMEITVFLTISVFLNVVFGDTAFFEAQNKLGVKLATPLVNIYPFGTIILAIIFLSEEISSGLLFGGIILISGVIFLSIDRIDPIETEEKIDEMKTKIVGLFLVFFAIFCYALGVIFTTIASENISAVVANSVRLPMATLGLFTLTGVQNRINENHGGLGIFKKFTASSRNDKILLLIAGVFGTYLSSYFLVLSVQEIGASRSAILFSTGPFFALPLAILWLKEIVSWITLIGTILTVFGLWIILS